MSESEREVTKNELTMLEKTLNFLGSTVTQTLVELHIDLNLFTNGNDVQRRRQWHPTLVLLPGKSHGREEPGRLQSIGSLRVGHD